MDFDVLANRREKIKESKNIDKYLDLARELNPVEHYGDGDNNCSWKSLEKKLEELKIRGRIDNIKTTTLFWSARILRRVLETGGDLARGVHRLSKF